jgi:dolichol-phosphate mannosyltransferase
MPENKILVSVFVYNEREKLKKLLTLFPEQRNYDLLFVDDGSTDGCFGFLQERKETVIRHESNRGIGVGIREAIGYGRDKGYEVIVVMAANGKMLPEEISRLVGPIVEGRADYVQGSRYLAGGRSPNLPLFRRIMIRLFTLIVNIATGYKGSDVTCGFRAYRLVLFDDERFDIAQDWLDRYEMEYYIHYHTLRGGYRVIEAPVSMVYPDEKKNYSKIKPWTGWWSMVRPWIYLYLGLKK